MAEGDLRHSPAALPAGKIQGTHCTGGWVGPTTALDGWANFHSHRDSITEPTIP
jgi:hypothetical protein